MNKNNKNSTYLKIASIFYFLFLLWRMFKDLDVLMEYDFFGIYFGGVMGYFLPVFISILLFSLILSFLLYLIFNKLFKKYKIKYKKFIDYFSVTFMISTIVLVPLESTLLIVSEQYDNSVKNNITEDIKYQEIDEITHATSNEELCIEGAFTAPLQQEIDFNNIIKEDKFVQYLRETLDKISNNVIVDDDYFEFENDFDKYREYIKSKFIVISTDIAPAGGESIVIMFKDKPDKLFYVWIYSDSEEYYDLRGFIDLTGLDKERIKEIQEVAINQLCDEDFGI